MTKIIEIILKYIPDGIFVFLYNIFLSKSKGIVIRKHFPAWLIIGLRIGDVSLQSPTPNFFNVHYQKFVENFDKFFYIENGDTVLDVGACIGDTTVYMGLKAGHNGKVIAIEVDSVNCHYLRLNLLKYIENYEVHEIAAYKRKTELMLFTHHTPTGHALLPDKSRKSSVSVNADTIDNIVNGRHVDFAKIDVQGSEIDVLKGADYLLRTTPKIMVETHYKYTERKTYPQVIKILESYGYTVTFIFDNGIVYGRRY